MAQRTRERVLDIFFASGEPLLEDAAGCEVSFHDIVEFLGIEQARRGRLDRRWRIQRDDVECLVAAQKIAAAIIDDDVSLRIADHIFEIRKEETERHSTSSRWILRLRSEEHTSELQSPDHLVCR